MKKELLEAIKNHMLYDYIANNYWKLTQYELGFIAKELAFAVDIALKKDAQLVWDEMIDNIETELEEEDE